jgi:hypothetical protein
VIFKSYICKKLNPNSTPNNRDPISFGLFVVGTQRSSLFRRLAGITGFLLRKGVITLFSGNLGFMNFFQAVGDYVVLGIIWRKSLLATWRKSWACRSWRSCRQRLGILRYHASGCLNHTLSSIDRRGSSVSGRRNYFWLLRQIASQRFTPHTAITYTL